MKRSFRLVSAVLLVALAVVVTSTLDLVSAARALDVDSSSPSSTSIRSTRKDGVINPQGNRVKNWSAWVAQSTVSRQSIVERSGAGGARHENQVVSVISTGSSDKRSRSVVARSTNFHWQLKRGSRTHLSTSPLSTQTAAPLRVSVYGDSIAAELPQYLNFWLRQKGPTAITWHVYGGTNACDWMNVALAESRSITPPQVVVTLFTGNAFTPCMNPDGRALSRPEVADKTVADSDALAGRFPSATIYRVGAPRSIGAQVALDADPNAFSFMDVLIPMLQSHNEGHPNWHYVDRATPLTINGRSVMTMPCTIFDGADAGCKKGGSGQVTVRAPDGGHLCPVARSAVEGVLPGKGCPIYSPGANRLSIAIAIALTSSYPPVTERLTTVKTNATISAATVLGAAIPKGATAVVTIATSSKTICAASGTSIKGLKAGTCRATIAVTPKATKSVPRPATTRTSVVVTVIN